MSPALDWREAHHFDRTRTLPCRWCGRQTPLRDDQRRPSHKVCAEQHTPVAVPDPVTPGHAAPLRPAAVASPEEPVPDNLFTTPANGRRHRGKAA
ncbi:hypothetical protein ACFVUH_34475 [Kitasatospora sp. NPDC058032]|uniref:hypothetical protein n=1 Tax=Kitasatospora sp. NPDC058032 TaxID=3346307 RepID=UPI0036DE1F0F